jgi:heme-degrading monooxygenase HmoA
MDVERRPAGERAIEAARHCVIEIIWLFEARPDRRAEFIRIYGPDGDWAKLFRHHPGYSETLLLGDTESPNRFLVVDRWQDRTSFEAFKLEFRADYDALDRRCEALTLKEQRLGEFNLLP